VLLSLDAAKRRTRVAAAALCRVALGSPDLGGSWACSGGGRTAAFR
jgi:hypothetical protein